MSIIREVSIDGRTIKFEFNKFAKQANGSVMVSSGGTQVLVAVCANEEAQAAGDFLPLSVDYMEKSYASGRIPGGYLKREGKPPESATLLARVIDRPLRPCFPEGYRNDTVITATVMSYEHGYNPGPLALIGASCALMISEIPFNGPVAALNIGLKDGKYILDAREGEEDDLDLDLMIACKPNAVLMVEAGAKFLSEQQMLEAIEFAHKTMQPFFDLQYEIQKEFGKPKWELPSKNTDTKALKEALHNFVKAPMKECFSQTQKQKRNRDLKKLFETAQKELNPSGDEAINKQLDALYEDEKAMHLRFMILEDKRRIDGRSLKQIRPISCEANILKRAHGSALFTRGETQSLTSATLAAGDDQQRYETLWSTEVRDRFMLHYNFPPYSVGEARMQRPPGRREIGHGELARKALAFVLPPVTEFAYTIRLVAETLESNGSSSMAAVCAGTMALLNAGVPIKAPVAGIAMGLIKEDSAYAVLSDIQGEEDHLGDMDFKVCGTKDGITALQMDIKIDGISSKIMLEALEQAREGRLHILGKMAEAISDPETLSPNAPRIFKLKINTDKIRDVIGPSGKNIKRITAEAGVKIDIDDTGIISIVAPDAPSAQAAKTMIRSFTTTPQVGDVYLGKVVRIVDFGVFVELRPGIDGLCHISQLEEERVDNIEDVVKAGQELLVKIVDIDKQGRIKLSRKEALGERPSLS